MQSAVLIAFDWGTTHVRAALLDRTGMALEERRGKSGVGQVDENGYRAIFDDLTRGWPLVPALACGMVGSRQGWLEAPYIACPAGLDGLADGLARIDLSERVLAIVPGLKVDQPNQKDVMRGEETALAGIVARDPNASATVVMPGTHSKWVTLRQGEVAAFRTYMTGEMFSAISGHTILRHSMSDDQATDDADFVQAYKEVAHGWGSDWGRFFSAIRGEDLLGAHTGSINFAERLSGLLIGTEYAAAKVDGFDFTSIKLVGDPVLMKRYALGAELLDIDVDIIDQKDLVWPALFAIAKRSGMIGREA